MRRAVKKSMAVFTAVAMTMAMFLSPNVVAMAEETAVTTPEEPAISELSVSEGTLTPEFAPDVTDYVMEVASDVTTVNVTAKAADENSAITVCRAIAVSGGSIQLTTVSGSAITVETASGSAVIGEVAQMCFMGVGEIVAPIEYLDEVSSIYIMVEAADGSSVKIYHISVVKEAEPVLMPIFVVKKDAMVGDFIDTLVLGVREDAKVTYSSSNKKVATVNEFGIIRAIKQGSSFITCEIEQNGVIYRYQIKLSVSKKKNEKGQPQPQIIRNGFMGILEQTVDEASYFSQMIFMLDDQQANQYINQFIDLLMPEYPVVYLNVDLQKGKTDKLNFTDAEDATFTFTSSNEKVVEVSEQGVVKARKKGYAVVTVEATKENVTCTYKVIYSIN